MILTHRLLTFMLSAVILGCAVVAADSANAQSEAAPSVQAAADPIVLGQQLREGLPVSDDNPLRVPDLAGARAAFEAAVAQGGTLPEVRLALAKMLLSGLGGPVEIDRAMTLLRQALRAGKGEAAFVLAVEMMKRDDPEAAPLLETALRLGYGQAGLLLAEQRRDIDESGAASLLALSIAALEQQADAGEASAAFALGEFYRSATEPALDDAIRWYERAAALGNARALYWMGRLYADPVSAVSDVDAAVRVYDEAASLGSVDSARALIIAAAGKVLPVEASRVEFWIQKLLEIEDVTALLLNADRAKFTFPQRKELSDSIYARLMADPNPVVDELLEAGSRFRDGVGLLSDPARALDLFGRGLSLGHTEATQRFAELVVASPVLQTEANAQRAYDAIRSLVDSGSVSSAVILADMLVRGIGTAPDLEQAIRLYETAANEAGSISAMVSLGDLYRASPDQEARRPAIAWFERAAEAGSLAALMSLAQAYENGDIVDRDRLVAIDYYQRAIDAGAEKAPDALAALYLQTGGERSMRLARAAFERAIDKGHPDALIKYAAFLVKTGNSNEAVPMLERPEFSERVDVALALAQIYSSGAVGAIDVAKTNAWLQVAVERVGVDPRERLAVAVALLGSQDALLKARAAPILQQLVLENVGEAARYLGAAYLSGNGVGADAPKGVASYMAAIEMGDAKARVELADAFAEGTHIPQDVERAIDLYEEALALNADDPTTNLRLGRLYSAESGGRRDLATAAAYYRRAAEAGDPAAQFALGNAYTIGAGVPPDEAQARKWLASASDAGLLDATVTLAAMYTSATAAEIDPAAAFVLNHSAAVRNHVPAMLEVGVALVSGFGAPKDPDAGVRWLEKAAGFGSSDAMYDLYELYSGGIGIKADENVAATWLQRAADAGSGSAMYRIALSQLTSDDAAVRDEAVTLLNRAASLKHNQSKKMLVKLGLLSASEAELE